jgi:hypothetical protein
LGEFPFAANCIANLPEIEPSAGRHGMENPLQARYIRKAGLSAENKEGMTALPMSRVQSLVWAGRLASAVCLGGVIWGGILFFGSDSTACTDLSSASCRAADPEISRQEEFELEKIGGMAMVYAVRLNHWLADWFHGIKLAALISALSLLTAVLCYREAQWLKELEEDEAEEQK